MYVHIEMENLYLIEWEFFYKHTPQFGRYRLSDLMELFYNGNWTEWSAIWSEIIRVIWKSDEFDLKSQVWFQTKIARHEVQLPLYYSPFEIQGNLSLFIILWEEDNSNFPKYWQYITVTKFFENTTWSCLHDRSSADRDFTSFRFHWRRKLWDRFL